MASAISALNLLILFGARVNVISTDSNIRLVPGPEEGQLEVLHGGKWGTVKNGCPKSMCDGSFTNQAASVVCRSLGQPSKNSYWVSRSTTGVDYLAPRLSRVTCNGMEASLFDCSLTTVENTKASYVVGIVCTDERMHAVIRYAGDPIQRNKAIDIYKNDYIYCDVGSSIAKDFNCSMTSVEGTDTGECPRVIFVEIYNLTRLVCSISNWQMPNQDAYSVNINVMYPPQAYVSQEMKVDEHTRVNMTLTNLPNPLPKITMWRKTGTRLAWNQTEVFRIFNNVSREDAGEYLVVISNTMNSSAGIQKQGNGLEMIFLDVRYQEDCGVSGQSPLQNTDCPNILATKFDCQTQLASMYTITYSMIGVTVASLVSVLVMAVVVIKMRTTKGEPVSPNVSRRASDSATATDGVQNDIDSDSYVYWSPLS